MQVDSHSNHLFPKLSPREDVPPYAAELGAIDGPMDGGYAHLNNLMIPAGYTYFAQFVTHDLTCSTPPRLNLSSIYGNGPWQSPWLYDEFTPGLLRTGKSLGDNLLSDVPRDASGRASIGDPRNDHTLILVQLHAAFIHLHNITFLAQQSRNWMVAFHESQQLIQWQYQWFVVNDLLKRLVGNILVDQTIKDGSAPISLERLPLEFTLAVGRFGHAMVQPRYRINDKLDAAVVFKDNGGIQPFDDLRGQPLDERAAIAWDNFFPIGNPIRVQASSKLNGKVCRPLFQFPYPTARSPLECSIPYRTLIAGQRAGLPSGQQVAHAMGFDPISEDMLWKDLPYCGSPAPLWFYVLREAEYQHHGQQLGQVGAQILTNIIIGALKADRSSYLFQHSWPTEMANTSIKSIGDLLRTVTENNREAWRTFRK